jgi:D-alanyl-D-alanine carboxypeptidase/D-alanyl-D-alanine-endopeptidase (penicillin-binding protein 4)
MWRHPHREAFIDSLPVSGTDGTLAGRLKEPTVFRKILAKTGALSHVHALAGYLQLDPTNTLAFSIMLNQYSGDRVSARAAVDEVVRLVAESAVAPVASDERNPETEQEPEEVAAPAPLATKSKGEVAEP